MPRFKNLVGQRFGRLTVISKQESVKKQVTWLCKCDCGNQKIVKAGQLRTNRTKSCGCYRKEVAKKVASILNFKDLTGKRFSRLQVLNRHGSTKHGQASWECLCDCGVIKIINSQALISKFTTSCGCYHKEIMIEVGKSGRMYYDIASAPKQIVRSVKLFLQTPKWANKDKIKEIYKNRPKGFDVDHIIPLQGKFVSGLHVENNLQYLTVKENRSKYNKF